MAYYKVRQSDDVWFCFRVETNRIGTYGETSPCDDFNTLLSVEHSIEDAIEYIVAICNREVDYIDKDIFRYHQPYMWTSYEPHIESGVWCISWRGHDDPCTTVVYESEEEAVANSERIRYEKMLLSIGREQAKETERRYMMIGIIKDRLTYKPKPKKTTPPAISLFA